MTVASIVFDVACLVVLVVCAIYYTRKGFVSGLIGLLGTALALFLAVLAAHALAGPLFDKFFMPRLEEQTATVVGETTVQTTESILDSLDGVLPDFAIDKIGEYLVANNYNTQSGDFVSMIVNDVIKPMIVPIIVLVLFLLVFLLLRVIVGVVSRLLKSVTSLPLLGTANKALGAVMGVLVGALYVFLLVMATKLLGELAVVNTLPLQPSILYGTLSSINILALTQPFSSFVQRLKA